MQFPFFKIILSHVVFFSALTSHVAQARLLEPGHPPTNCNAADFKLPGALVGAWDEAELPPFVTKEIFATFVSLKVGWSPGFKNTETPIVARLVHLVDTMHWNCAAMYSSTWLDGLTKEDPLLRSPVSFDDGEGQNIVFHASTPRLLCMVHAWAAVVDNWQPMAKETLSGVLGGFEFEDLTYGFNPEVDAVFDEDGTPNVDSLKEIAAGNCYKPKIMGAIVARQVTEYGRRDGYNMYGDLRKDGKECSMNCRRYTDPTNYIPLKTLTRFDEGRKGLGQTKKKKKFRWEPMQEDDNRGYFTRQEHVTPHIGTMAKRAVLSDEDFESRKLDAPMRTKKYYNKQARDVAARLKETATSDMKKAMIEFYDDKIKVAFPIIEAVLSHGTSFEQLLNYVFGYTAGEYDALLVSWKEKVAHDLVRPTTWIQKYMADEFFDTYGGPNMGVKRIPGAEFESWVRVMPHSEYISGSACICHTIIGWSLPTVI